MKRLQILLCIVALALAGCAAPPRGQPSVADTLRDSAQQHVAQGDYLAAAQLYLSASTTAPETQQPGLRLEAGRLLAQGELWDRLAGLLESIDPGRLDRPQQARYRLLQAELALAREQPEQALAELGAISNPEVLPDHGQRYYALRADAYALAGNALEAARQLIWLDGVVSDQQQRLDNQHRIWEQLSSLTSSSSLSTLSSLASLSGNDNATALASTVGNVDDSASLDSAFSALGMDSSMVSQFAPVLLSYMGGEGVSSTLLSSLSSMWGTGS